MTDNIHQRTLCYVNEQLTSSYSTQAESRQDEHINGHFFETIENGEGSPFHYFY
jgi:hypothetical protein